MLVSAPSGVIIVSETSAAIVRVPVVLNCIDQSCPTRSAVALGSVIVHPEAVTMQVREASVSVALIAVVRITRCATIAV